MSKLKLLIFVLLISIAVHSNCVKKITILSDDRREIAKYEDLLNHEPNNCLYSQQLASIYQRYYEFDNAIKYYQQTIALCPDDVFANFDLGVCFLFTLDRDKAVMHMDNAIRIANESSDMKAYYALLDEKEGWLAKWEYVKRKDWEKE